MSNSSEAKQPISKNQKAVLSVTAITAFLTTFSSSSMELSIPHMEAEFGVNAFKHHPSYGILLITKHKCFL